MKILEYLVFWRISAIFVSEQTISFKLMLERALFLRIRKIHLSKVIHFPQKTFSDGPFVV